MKKKFFILTIMLGSYIIIASKFFSTICIFRNITGLPCPGCGLTRAYLELFKGDIGKAFYYHPLFLLPSIMVITLIYNKLRINKFTINNKVAIFFVIVILVVYAVRMERFFPNCEPMTINYYGVIPRLLKFIGIIS